MKHLFLLLILLIVFTTRCLFAQNLDQFKTSDGWYKLSKEKTEKTKIENVQRSIKEDFKIKLEEEFVKVKDEVDNKGNQHLRYKHFINSIPVEGSEYFLHKKANSPYVDIVSTKIFSEIKIQKAQISEQDALNIALKSLPAEIYYWQDKQMEAEIKQETNNTNSSYYPKGVLIYSPQNSKNLKSSEFELCYSFKISAVKPFLSKEIFINATTGAVHRIKDLIQTCNDPATATTLYNGNQTIITNHRGFPYYNFNLEECNRNIHTKYGHDLNPEATNSSTVWGTNDQLATSAHWGAEMTWDLYRFTYGRTGTDNAGRQIKVHADDPSATDRGGAYYNYSGGGNDKVHIGNSSQGLSCASLDVVAHEITHGLTHATAGLDRDNEPGALNESFSDIFGLMTERRTQGGVFNWRIAELPFPVTNGIRAFDNPGVFNHSSCFNDALWNTNTGVHAHAGVQNHWFFLLANAIEIDNAARIAWDNLIFHLGTWSNYNDTRNGSIAAAINLFGECSNEEQEVENAWAQVCVGAPANPNCITLTVDPSAINVCYDQPNPYTQFPITVTANFLPANATLTWTVPPEISFSTSGNQLIIEQGPLTPGAFIEIIATVTSGNNAASFSARYITYSCYGGITNRSGTDGQQMRENSNTVIYPNPAKNLVNVFVKTRGKIKLADLNGRVLLEKQSTPGLNTINTSNLSNGIYIVFITEGGKTKSHKITIIH